MAPQIDMQRKGEHGEDTVRRLLRGLTIPWPVERGLLTLAKSLETTKAQLKTRLSEKTDRYQAQIERQTSLHKLELEKARTDHEGEVLVLNGNLVQANLDTGIQISDHAMEIKNLKDELTKAHADHVLEIARLTQELEQARRNYSGDDDLVELYHAGTRLLAKQTAEVKSLKAGTQREKDEHERLKKCYTLETAEKNNENAALVEAAQRLSGRLASLTTESTDAEADLKRRLAGSRDLRKAAVARSNKLEEDILAAKKVIDDLRREIGDGKNAELRKKSEELLERLRKVEQHCEGYRSAAVDQQKFIEKLSKENAKLVGGFGRQHFHRDG